MATFSEVRIPLANMAFTPDVPSTALQPNEYNSGENVETDVRGIRSVAGDQAILQSVPGQPTFITGNYRGDGNFWFIVATTEGNYWMSKGDAWINITPSNGPYSGYNLATNIIGSWNGTVLFINDSLNPPMFLPDYPAVKITPYSNQIPLTVANITSPDLTHNTAYFYSWQATDCTISGTTLTIGTINTSDYSSETVSIGNYIVGPGVAAGTYIVSNISGTGNGSTWQVNIGQAVGGVTMEGTTVAVAPFSVGSQVIIGGSDPSYFNGTFTVTDCDQISVTYLDSANYIYSGGATVAPLYTWNYNPAWSSVSAAFMRIYNTPNVGSILIAGNLTAQDIPVQQGGDGKTLTYPVTIQWSQAFGLDQAPQTWTPTITNVANQLEVPLRGPALDGFGCQGQFYLCSYWDTVVFSPINYSTTSAPILGVSLASQGRGLLSSNCWAAVDNVVYGVDARDIWVFNGQSFSGLGNQVVKNYFYQNLNPNYVDRVWMLNNSKKSQIEIYYPDLTSTNGTCNKMLSYRYDLQAFNAPRDMQNATLSCESPVWNYNGSNWQYNYGSRGVVYAQGLPDAQLVQKDQGTSFLGNAISSVFRRDNIKLLKDYSGHLLVHRILPEVVNLDNYNTVTESTGNITVTVEGANSVGQDPVQSSTVTIPINTNNPWAQINQNAYRVNSLILSNTSNSNVWMCSAASWQYKQTQDDR